MTEHSNIIGGSSAERRINCPPSYKLELPYPNKGSSYAEEGTACHEAMEHILLEECAPTDVIGMTFNKGNEYQPEGYVIDDTLFETKILPAWEAWQEVLEEYGELDYMVEARCDLSSVIPGAFGTVDVLAQPVKRPKLKIVADWKFGAGVPVSPYGNYQCGFYGGAALHTTDDPDIVEIMADAEEFAFIIIQPKNGEAQWQVWHTPRKWVEMLIELAQNAVTQAQSDKPGQPKPGKHCRWCKAKADCSAQLGDVDAALSAEPDVITAVERGYWLNKAEQLEGWIKALRAKAHEDIEKGVAVPGWKTVAKRGTRSFVGLEESEIVELLDPIIGHPYNNPKLMSAAQAETALKKEFAAKKAKRGEWKEVWDAKIAPHVKSVSSGTTLAPDTDKRPAVTDSIELLAKALGDTQSKG